MKRLIEKMVFLGLVTDCRLATWPTRRSPPLVKATTEGVVRLPSAFGITFASVPSMTATTLFVVPRSIPIILLTSLLLPSAPGLRTDSPRVARDFKTLEAPCQISAAPMLTISRADLFLEQARRACGRRGRQEGPGGFPGSVLVEQDDGRTVLRGALQDRGIEEEVPRDRADGVCVGEWFAAVGGLQRIAVFACRVEQRLAARVDEVGWRQLAGVAQLADQVRKAPVAQESSLGDRLDLVVQRLPLVALEGGALALPPREGQQPPVRGPPSRGDQRHGHGHGQAGRRRPVG